MDFFWHLPSDLVPKPLRSSFYVKMMLGDQICAHSVAAGGMRSRLIWLRQDLWLFILTYGSLENYIKDCPYCTVCTNFVLFFRYVLIHANKFINYYLTAKVCLSKSHYLLGTKHACMLAVWYKHASKLDIKLWISGPFVAF